MLSLNKIYSGDSLEVLKTFPDECIDCVITSPPYYGLRDYSVDGQIGLEKTLDEYLEKMLAITAELKRVLKLTGTMWWNHGDSYSGSMNGAGDTTSTNRNKPESYKQMYKGQKPGNQVGILNKSLLLQAHRLAIRMVDEQKWILRNTIIWHKPNVMPSSVKDRFTVDYEPVFFFTKSKKYWFETQYEPYGAPMNRWGGYKLEAKGKSEWDRGTGQSSYRDRNMRPNELGRNKRAVWKIATHPFSEAHFATFPEKLIEPMVKAGCPEFICKKCGKAREKIFEGIGGSIGKSWHSHKEDLTVGAGQISRIGDCVNEKGEKYQRIDKGHTDCGCNAGWTSGIVLDPFMGAGTTAKVARMLGRNYVGIELNEEYIKIANKRLAQQILC